MSALARADVAIVGGGIVGLSCAFRLMRRGLRCVLVDPAAPGTQTSGGNAGSISVGSIIPHAAPGVAWKGLRMLADPRAPLKLDLARIPAYWRWLLRFVESGSPARYAAIMDALHAINHVARAAWLRLAADIDASDLLRDSGFLHVYSDPGNFEAAAHERDAMQAHGVCFDLLDRAGIEALEPSIGRNFHHGVFQRDSLALLDPAAFCLRLHDALVAGGARWLQAGAMALVPDGAGSRVDTDRGTVHCDRVVVAAGVWAPALLAPLGVHLPLVAARGYHLMYAPQPGLLQRPTLWTERYMVMSPMAHGTRMTSIKELTTVERPPRYGMIRRRDACARTLFPGLAGAPVSEWAGLRPCTPDSLPVIDAVGESLYVACGHGHLGMTQGPVTGELLDQLIAGAPTHIPLGPYCIGRFAD